MTGQVELSGGTLEYEDTAGPGPVIVLLHGLMMDASLWTDVIAELAVDYRCIAPMLPLGAHRHGMRSDADLSMRGIACLVAELLDRLELDDVTLVGNNTGGALVQLLMRDRVGQVSRVVLVSCDAFDNFPPGLTGKALLLAGKLPPALFGLFMQQMRLRPLRRLPIAFGWLTIRGDATTARWIKPVLEQREIRRDAARMLRAAAAEPDLLLEAANGLPSFDRPALVVWASSDRVEQLSNVVDSAMKNDQAATLSSVVVSSSVTLIPSLNLTPSSTSPTSSWPLHRRQRSWAASKSL